MTEREQAILWLGSFRKHKKPMILIPTPLIQLMYDVLTKDTEAEMSERPKKRLVEFIESYWTGGEHGSDYQWNDNHGELIRCKDCKYRSLYCTEATDGTTLYTCHHPCANDVPRPLDWFCADGKRR